MTPIAGGRPSIEHRPLASIIVTNHDYGEFVGAAIESALAQSYPAVEVIVVDDGSEDDSHQVLASFADRVTVVEQARAGQGAACNTGFERSRGDVVVFLDADDLLAPEAIADAATAIDQSTAKVHWPLRILDEHDRLKGVYPTQALAEGNLRSTLIDDGPLSFPSAPMSGNAFPRAVLDEILPIPEADYRICADSYLNAMSPLFGCVRVLPGPHGCRRMHGANWSLKPLDRRLTESLAIWRSDCQWVRRRLAAEGLGSTGDWEANPFVRSMQRMAAALAIVRGCTSEGDTFVTVGSHAGDSRCVVAGRTASPLDRTAVTSQDALRAIEHHRTEGASVVVATWPAFGWLAQHGLRDALAERYGVVADTEDVVVFAL